MYKYKEFGFRPIDEDDLEALKELHNEESTLLQFKSVEMCSSPEQVEWWKRICLSKTEKRYCIVLLNSGERLGIIRVQHIDHLNKNCEIGLDILPEFRGKGYGKQSYEMLLDYLFMQYNMHMVYLRVTEFNPVGLNLYTKLGFKETGRLPEHIYRNGNYTDHVIFSMTRGAYERLREGTGKE